MILAFLMGCALSAHRAGLVEVRDGQATLMESTGRRWELDPRGEGATLLFLDGCIVEVGGPRLGRRQIVREWEVRDAGDGTQPYVGQLRRYGMQWMLDDRTTGMPLVLDETSVGELAAHTGELVLVQGYVVGAQTLRVVSWRALQ